MTEISPLRRRMIDDMTIRNLSPATQRSYLHAVTKFSRYFGRSPDRLGLEDVRAFQVHLVSSGLSWPALNQTVCALRFFFGVTLGHGEIPERIAYARTPVRFLEAVPSLRTRTALTTAYAAGLRASEAVHLKVRDIDGERGIIRVEHGKGGKDRNVMLSAQLLAILRVYWRLARPEVWLFPGRDETKPIDVQVLYSACRSACTAAGIDKRVTVHTLRHYLPCRTMSSSFDRNGKCLRNRDFPAETPGPPDIVSSIYRLFKNPNKLSSGRKRDDLPEYGEVFAKAASFIANVASR